MERHEEVLVALRRIIRAVDLHSKRLMQRTGLSGPQLVVMQVIDRGSPLSAGELARRASLSQATVTAILDRLEERGLVVRERSKEDRRRTLVALTAAGQEALAASPTLLQEHFVQRFAAMPDWEQHLVIASLQRVAHMMDAQNLDASPYLDPGELVAQ
ncbi:MAG: MarR family transcriptional regulator [Thiohalomonadaceae bacterium]